METNVTRIIQLQHYRNSWKENICTKLRQSSRNLSHIMYGVSKSTCVSGPFKYSDVSCMRVFLCMYLLSQIQIIPTNPLKLSFFSQQL